ARTVVDSRAEAPVERWSAMQLGQVLRSKIRNIPPLISVGLVLAACGTTPAAAPSVSANGSAGLKAAPAGAGASAPPAASRPPAAKLSPPSDWQAQWDRTLAAAKQEGSVSIISAPGDVYRQVFDVFQQKYGISVEVQVGNGQADLVPRIDNERKAGQYRWDVVVHSARSMFQGYKPLGALDSLRSALILPEVLDDSKWLDGFAGGWADLDSSLVYSFVRGAEPSARINRAVIPESQLSTVDQLWDPRWKGKMAWLDPRVPTGGQAVAVTIFATKGPDKLRTILRDQDPVLTQDRRQLGEWVVRGQYPIGFGVDVAVLTAFGQQGLDVKSIRPLEDSDPA